jgi:CheY-like chemotaxis protein
MVNKKLILVANNDPVYTLKLVNLLETAHFDVITAESGEECVKLTKRMMPSLILLSVELQDMNGFVVCKKIKEDPQLNGIPLILMSEDAEEGDFQKHRKLKVRADDYLHIPCPDEQLLQKINNFLGFHVTEEEFTSMQEQVLAVMQEKVELEKIVKEQKEEIERLNETILTKDKKIKKLEEEITREKEKFNRIKDDIINYLKDSD